MATQLTVVNNILERLREDTVSSVNETAYSKLIARFCNDAKNDIEDLNHTWSHYITEVDVSILSDGTRSYALSTTNENSFLMRNWKNEKLPQAYDVTAGEKGQLVEIPRKEIDRIRHTTNNIEDTETRPYIFSIERDTSNRYWNLVLLWGSQEARSWKTYWYIPQDDMALDGTDDATQFTLPARPIEMKAYYYALNERGEEMGQPNGITWQVANESIAAALELDLQVQKKSYEIDIDREEYI